MPVLPPLKFPEVNYELLRKCPVCGHSPERSAGRNRVTCGNHQCMMQHTNFRIDEWQNMELFKVIDALNDEIKRKDEEIAALELELDACYRVHPMK